MDKVLEFLDFPFELKAEDLRPDGSFSGWASPFGPPADAGKDIVMMGAFTNTIRSGGKKGTGLWPFLWHHDVRSPIGVIPSLEEMKTGVRVAGRYALDASMGRDAYALAKIGAADQLSIGYNALEYDMDEKRGIRQLKTVELYEVSQVTFGMAGRRASITSVKCLTDDEAKVLEQESEPWDESKPYPNEHACRLAEPGTFSQMRRKNGDRDHDGKKYDVIYGKKKSDGKWGEQAYRYPKDTWSASEARTHCKAHEGEFEAAGKSLDVIHEAKTERELEHALRDVGLGRETSKYLVSLCRGKLREAAAVADEQKGLDGLLDGLREVRMDFHVFGEFNL